MLNCVSPDNKKEFIGSGSGFVYMKPNILVTCNHVIEGSNSIILKFSSSDKYIGGKVVLRDDEHDLALIKFTEATKIPLNKAPSDFVTEGMPVIFSGYPFSTQTLTTHQGIISAIIKDPAGITNYLIDGTVNSGNSGCPLMNVEGEVLGVISAKRRNRNALLEQVEKMTFGAVSLHGVDIVEIYQALINNIQLGVGYAVPAKYIPDHKEIEAIPSSVFDKKEPIESKKNSKSKNKKNGK